MNRTESNKNSLQKAFKEKSGAKPKPNQRKKHPSPITLRLTAEERAQLRKDAAGTSQSAYIRSRLFSGKGTRKNTPVKDRDILSQVLARLGQTRIANNLNQIAHAANYGALLLDEETEEEIKQACAEINWIRVQLIVALGLKDGGAR